MINPLVDPACVAKRLNNKECPKWTTLISEVRIFGDYSKAVYTSPDVEAYGTKRLVGNCLSTSVHCRFLNFKYSKSTAVGI